MSAAFQFKRFSVNQTRAAMKVGFDGVLLGAWTNVQGCRRILDVGTGTGLIALMLAQRSQPQAIIHALDVDPLAVADATENFRVSPWAERLHVEHAAIENYANTCQKKFDLLVCNPPFYDGPESSDASRRHARHAQSLSLPELLDASERLFNDRGKLSVIVPSQLEEWTITNAHHRGWRPIRLLRVRPLIDRPVHRVLVELSRESRDTTQVDELSIETTRHQYTEQFRALARDFYLAF